MEECKAFLWGERRELLKEEKTLKFKHFTAISGVSKNLNLSLVETSGSLPEILNDLAVSRE